MNREKWLELSEIDDPLCITVYLSLGTETDKQSRDQNQIQLKNIIGEIEQFAQDQGLTQHEIDSLTEPVKRISSDNSLWRSDHRSLAIFRSSKGHFEIIPLNFEIESKLYLGTEFLLWPLWEWVENPHIYYVLTLGLDQCKLYKGTKYSFSDITPQDLATLDFEEITGPDYQQKNLQFHGYQGTKGISTYHGQGEGRDDVKPELEKYFRKVAQEIDKSLKDDNSSSLVLCGLSEYVGLFRKVCRFGHVEKEFIEINPSDKSTSWLQHQSWNLVSSKYDHDLINKTDLFYLLEKKGKASEDINQIANAAFDGRVDTLFINTEKSLFGIYDPSKRETRIDQVKKTNNTCLLNLSCILTIRNQGNVILRSNTTMPIENSILNAMFRF